MMDSVVYLYDSSGNWIAFSKGDYLFAPSGAWMGWFAHDNAYAFDIDGRYLGIQVGPDRLYHEIGSDSLVSDEHPGYPGRDTPPDHPGFPGRDEIPLGMEEVDLHQYA
jgi:hypothetical protein